MPRVPSRLETNHLDGRLFCLGPNGLVDWILMICWPFLHFNMLQYQFFAALLDFWYLLVDDLGVALLELPMTPFWYPHCGLPLLHSRTSLAISQLELFNAVEAVKTQMGSSFYTTPIQFHGL